LLDLVEEPFDQVARAVQIRAKTDRVFAIALRWDIGPRALLAGELPDPIRVVSTICEQHRLRKQGAEKNRTQPIVVRLTGRQSEMDRQAIAVHDRVNLTRQAPSRATHILVIVVRDAGSVLVHPHDGSIDHLHCRVMTGGQRIHDPVPYASLAPTNEAIVASGAGTMSQHCEKAMKSPKARPSVLKRALI
jgi:hypothetical protein